MNMMQGSKQIALMPSAMTDDSCQGAGFVEGSEAAVGRGVGMRRGRWRASCFKLLVDMQKRWCSGREDREMVDLA